MLRPLHHKPVDEADHWDDPHDRPGGPIVAIAFAASGAVVGFLLAGYIALGFGIFGGVVVGCVAGWWARGLSGEDDAE